MRAIPKSSSVVMTKTRIRPTGERLRACGVADIARRHLEGGELSEVDELTQAGLEVGRMPQLMFMPAELLARQRTVYAVTANRSVAFICSAYGIIHSGVRHGSDPCVVTESS
jgi:hypothetical protein